MEVKVINRLDEEIPLNAVIEISDNGELLNPPLSVIEIVAKTGNNAYMATRYDSPVFDERDVSFVDILEGGMVKERIMAKEYYKKLLTKKQYKDFRGDLDERDK